MLRSTSNVLFVAALAACWLALVTGVSLSGGQKTDTAARAEIAQSGISDELQTALQGVHWDSAEDLPIQEEKAVPRSVLKKTATASRYSKHQLYKKQEAKEELAKTWREHQDGKSKHQYNKQMGKTLKGIKYEATKKATTVTVTIAPSASRLRKQPEMLPDHVPESLEKDAIQQHDNNEQDDEDHEEENAEDESNDAPDSWLHVGAKVEWNPMVGKKAKYLLKENDWIEVTVVDKEVDGGVNTWGIQKGPLQTRVPQDQLRRAVKAKRLAEEKKREEAFWSKRKPTTAPNDGLEDVMVPLKAKSGRTCRGDPIRLSSDQSEYHEDGGSVDAEDCRSLCEKNSKCKFASHGMYKGPKDAKEVVSCLSFESCDETTGKHWRTWQKERMDPDKANKARTSERNEDEYISKIKEAEEISLQRLEEDLVAPAMETAAPSKKRYFAGAFPRRAIVIPQGRETMGAEDSFMAIPFWRHLLELGAIAVLLGMWSGKMQVSKQRKQVAGQQEMKEPNALDKLLNWIQRETTPLIAMVQKMVNPPKMEGTSDLELNSELTSSSITRRFEKAAEDLDQGDQKSNQPQVRKYQTPLPEDDGVDRGDARVNRSALRAAFHMAGNKRTSDFR
jgi:hypothetical protein